MSDDITIGTSGDVVVMSEAVRTALHAISTIADELPVQRARLVRLVGESEAMPVAILPVVVAQSLASVESAVRLLDSAERRARSIDHAVVVSLAGYETTERVAGSLWHGLSQQLAWLAGASLRVAAVPLAIGAAGAAVNWLIASKITGVSLPQVGATAGAFLEAHPRIISNPLVVGELREMVSDSDEFGEGFLGVPQPIPELLGANGLGVLGVASSARVIDRLGGVLGLLRETAVTVKRTSIDSSPTSVETGAGFSRTLAQRASQFISADKQPNGEQVRIEKFTQPGRAPRYEVYVAGTVTFDPISAAEPFDMTSNMSGVAAESPGAYRAVVDAMKQAGITSTSPVVVNGYSQGGLIASLVASSNEYNVKGLVTFGAPAGQIPIADSIPTLTVRHTEDIVPSLGGNEVNRDAVVVYRTLFDERNPPTDLPVAGHDFGFYKQTAAIIDRSDNPELRGVLDPINHFEDGATRVTTTMYVAHRVQP
ncbi:MAG: hypothetical protein QOE85_1517 [Actinomycetota bacterium]|nr:hypothetical protein [Actinomycetota bacterium]